MGAAVGVEIGGDSLHVQLPLGGIQPEGTPVAQKVHPITHPTCDDTHSVERTLPLPLVLAVSLSSAKQRPAYVNVESMQVCGGVGAAGQPVVSYCMMTASTSRPSCSRTRSLVVSPSLEVCFSTTVDVNLENWSFRSRTAALGRSGTSSHEQSGFRMT
jgi:hypothetical protein